jgi:ATP:ADP antiporter, AAA family
MTTSTRPSALDRMLLTTYYILKPVREALILGQGSPELKTYLSVGQVALLSIAVPVYGSLAANLHRRSLLNTVTYFFVACLVLFYVLGQGGVLRDSDGEGKVPGQRRGA